MRAWVVTGTGEPAAVLERRDLDPPEPSPGTLRLRVDAAALGMPDVFMCRGTYPLTPPRPFVPGQEAVGRVEAVGEGVDAELVGRRVMGVVAFYLGAGACADAALATPATLHHAPDELDDASAAGFHIPFHTAWIGLRDRARLSAGETLVVLGAAGGSGAAAVLLGVALGARVIAVVGGARKAAWCIEIGAHHVVDHTNADVAAAVLGLTDGRGADVVYDPVGGEPGEAVAAAVAGEGRLLLVGFAAGRWPVIDAARLVHGNFSVLGVYAGAYDRAHGERLTAELLALRATGRLSDLPTTVVGFDDVPAALGRIADRQAMGKTVVRMVGGA